MPPPALAPSAEARPPLSVMRPMSSPGRGDVRGQVEQGGHARVDVRVGRVPARHLGAVWQTDLATFLALPFIVTWSLSAQSDLAHPSPGATSTACMACVNDCMMDSHPGTLLPLPCVARVGF